MPQSVSSILMSSRPSKPMQSNLKLLSYDPTETVKCYLDWRLCPTSNSNVILRFSTFIEMICETSCWNEPNLLVSKSSWDHRWQVLIWRHHQLSSPVARYIQPMWYLVETAIGQLVEKLYSVTLIYHITVVIKYSASFSMLRQCGNRRTWKASSTLPPPTFGLDQMRTL